MLFGKILSEKVELSDKNRFFIGSIMPDAYVEPSERKRAHFIKQTADDNGRFFDFPDFYERYKDKLLQTICILDIMPTLWRMHFTDISFTLKKTL